MPADDLLGNRGSMADQDNHTITYSYDVNNRLTQLQDVAGITYFDYDDNGNLVTATLGSDITHFAWDQDDSLTGITYPNLDTLTFGYDAEGNRALLQEVAGPAQRFLYEGSRVYGEYNSTWGLQARYVLPGGSYLSPLLGMRRNSQNWHDLSDGMGSTVLLVDPTDTAADAYTYDAFGNLLTGGSGIANPFRYLGGEGYYSHQTTALLQTGARYYLPSLGRFISEDPIGFAGGLNPYLYCDNDPVNLSDPTGLMHTPGFMDTYTFDSGGGLRLAWHSEPRHPGALVPPGQVQ